MCQNADAFRARDSRGLIQHLARRQLGQALREDTVAQLRALKTRKHAVFVRVFEPEKRRIELHAGVPQRRARYSSAI